MMGSPRASLAGLMGVVVAVALGLAALRNPTTGWFGITSLVTGGVLMLAVVGAVCRRGASRAWWFGFALFGWGYLAVTFGISPMHPFHPMLVTRAILLPLKAAIHPADQAPPPRARGRDLERVITAMVNQSSIVSRASFLPRGVTFLSFEDPFLKVGHALLALAAGMLGGVLGRTCFGSPAEGMAGPGTMIRARGDTPIRLDADRLTFWRRPEVILLGGTGVVAIAGVTARYTTSLIPFDLASALTASLLALATLAAVRAPAPLGTRWMGAALFGVGILVLGLRTDVTRAFWPNEMLESRSLLPYTAMIDGLHSTDDSALFDLVRNLDRGTPQAKVMVSLLSDFPMPDRAVLEALERSEPLHFPNDTPLEAVLADIRDRTRSLELPDGLPIYVDPGSLADVERSMTSPVHIDLAGVPLADSLRLVLAQLGLDYIVKGRLVFVITRRDSLLVALGWRYATVMGVPSTPFHNLTQCAFALLAAALGSLAVRLVIPCSMGASPADGPRAHGPG